MCSTLTPWFSIPNGIGFLMVTNLRHSARSILIFRQYCVLSEKSTQQNFSIDTDLRDLFHSIQDDSKSGFSLVVVSIVFGRLWVSSMFRCILHLPHTSAVSYDFASLPTIIECFISAFLSREFFQHKDSAPVYRLRFG